MFLSGSDQEPYGAGVGLEDLVDGIGLGFAVGFAFVVGVGLITARGGRTSSGSTRATSAVGTFIRLTTAGSMANSEVSFGLNRP